MTITLLKILLVLVILSAMVILLVTINHYLAHNFYSDEDDVVSLRNDIETQRDVITDKNSFSGLIAVRENSKKKIVKNINKNMN